MTDYPGQVDIDGHGPIFAEYPGRAVNAHAWGPQKAATPSFATECLETPATTVDDPASITHRAAVSPADYPAELVERSTPGFDWFERVHIIPRVFAFGSVLTQIQDTFELYSAYRVGNVNLNSFTNTIDPGVTIPDLPGLPYALGPQSGVELTIQVDPIGAVSFAGDLLFTFDVQEVPLTISGERLILWFFDPERPIEERLAFLTQIIPSRTGLEQRIRQRGYPRQSFRISYRLEGRDRRKAVLRLMDWQGRSFGIPLREQGVQLTADASATDTVSVYTTEYSDFREGGLAVVFLDQDTFDVLEIDTITATTIQFTSNLQNSYLAGHLVMPVRTAELPTTVSGQRYAVNVEDLTLLWTVLDNEVNLASVAGFSSYDGKVLFDDPNIVIGDTKPEEFRFRVYDTDAETGLTERQIIWDQNKRIHQKAFVAITREAAWKLRQVLFAIRGRQVSFYIPTFADDLLVTANLTASANKMDVEHVGYVRFAQDRLPKNVIRVTFTDGTTLERVVLSSVEVDSDTERLSLDDVWPSTKTPEEVERVEFYELVRFDTDEFVLLHSQVGRVSMNAPVRAIFEAP